MVFSNTKSKYNVGDTIREFTITDIGILGSKLSGWCFVYTLKDEEGKLHDLITEKVIDRLLLEAKSSI